MAKRDVVDTDELDKWLESDDDGDGSGPQTGWPPAPAASPEGRTSGRRPRWLVPAGAAIVIWLAVMAVVVLGAEDVPRDGGDPITAGTADEGVTGTAEAAGDTAAGDMTAEDMATSVVDGGEGTATTGDPTTADMASDQNPGDGPVADDLDEGVLHGAAVSALRVQLTGSADGRDRYLELATPVAVRPLGDAVTVVLVDTVWLEGTGGQLTEVHQGRWSVPIALDGTLLGAAWQVAGAPAQAARPPDPPLGTLRLPEVAQAMHAAGWTEVVAAAADPHPFLDHVLVALVQGTTPSGAVSDGDVVWLMDGDEGLMLLGAGA